jgi:hypothetical protein
MHEWLGDIKRIECDEIDYHTESDDYFEIIKGNIPILISAPHGAKHLRDGKWKEEDEYTAAIAIKLGEMTGAHVIYVKNKTREDSNQLEKTKYKEKIKEIVEDYGIKFLADIHGAKKDRDFKVCVGIIDIDENSKSCSCRGFKAVIEEVFSDFQSPIFNLEGLNAADPRTVTYFAKNICKIKAAQFEINANYRIIERKPDSSKAIEGVEPDFKAEEKDVLELLNRLKEMILRIKEKIVAESNTMFTVLCCLRSLCMTIFLSFLSLL